MSKKMIQKKYKIYPLSDLYLQSVNDLLSIKLTIIGRDQFPENALDIPFIKEAWTELDRRSAGFHLFNSLHSNFNKNEHNPPLTAVFELLQHGIVFLNASYNFLEKETINYCKHIEFVRNATNVNLPILEKSENVVMCGDAKTMLDWVITYGSNFYEAPHPSLQSRNRSIDKEKRDHFWLGGKLKTKFNLST